MEHEMGMTCTMQGRIGVYKVLEGKSEGKIPTMKTYVYMGG
jgi:hypothetical protein